MLEVSLLILAGILLKCLLLLREVRDLLKSEAKREPDFVHYPVFRLEELQAQIAKCELSFSQGNEMLDAREEYPLPDVSDPGYRELLKRAHEAEQRNADDVRKLRFMIESNFRVRSGLSNIEVLASQREELFGSKRILARVKEAEQFAGRLYEEPNS